jgi:DNA repair protein RadC
MTDLYVKTGTRYRAASRGEVIDAAGLLMVAENVQTRPRLDKPTAAAGICRALVGDRDREFFGVLFLDTRHRLIAAEQLFSGTIDGAVVYPREVVKRALEVNAAALILTHNHPSGDPEPSEADRSITAKLAQALALIDVRLLDHLVIAGERHVSLAERGWI